MNEMKVRITLLNTLQRYFRWIIEKPYDFIFGLFFIIILKSIIGKIFTLSSFGFVFLNIILSISIWEVAIIFLISRYSEENNMLSRIKKNIIKYLLVVVVFSIYIVVTATLMGNLAKAIGSFSLVIQIIGYIYFANVLYGIFIENDRRVFKKAASIIKGNAAFYMKYLIASLLFMVTIILLFGFLIKGIFPEEIITQVLPIIGISVYFIITPISFLYIDLKSKEDERIGIINRST